MNDNLLTLGAAELVRRIRARQISPLEVVETHIARLEAVNPAINAVITPRFERAIEEAKAATERLAATPSDDLPPLFGVPVTIKDALAVAGVRFTAGAAVHRDRVAEADAAAVARLKAAGAIILGKTNCPEMSGATETVNPIFGLTRNPWNPARTAGGSSGGEGAIIAAGGSPLGLGSDIAGSIRLPSAMCGVVGLKPTGGRIPTEGHDPAAPDSIRRWNTVGPLARRVEDAALALSVLSDTPVKDYRRIDLKGRRVVTYRSPFIPLAREVAGAVESAADALQEAGMQVKNGRGLPFMRVLFAALAIMNREWLPSLRAALGGGEPVVLWRELVADLRGQGRISATGVWLPLEVAMMGWLRRLGIGRRAQLERWRAQLLAVMGVGGVLLCPVFPVPAPRHGFIRGIYGSPYYTLSFNVLELPAASVPVGFSRNGLPLNVQVVGHPGEDETVLAVAAALERAFGGWQMASPPFGG